MNIAVETRRHILLTRKESGVAILLLDCPAKLNTLSTLVMNELRAALKAIADDRSIKAAVFMSGKPDTFIIGADLFEIRKSESGDLQALTRLGQATLNEGVALSKPIVVGINGICLGGGLESAMAGHWRIATNTPATQLGLPETRLGLIPGLGGTQRLPRIVGLKQALGMILSAEPISAEEALACGLVDELVSPDELMSRAEQRALDLVAHPDEISRRRALLGTADGSTAGGAQPSPTSWPLPDVDQEKAGKLFAMTERSIRIRTKGNYPAQTRVVEVIKTGLSQGIEAGLELEARTFVELAGSDTAANLIALFFQTDFARQSAGSLAAKFGENNTAQVGVIGGGLMGGSIAQISAPPGRGITTIVKVNPGRARQVEERLASAAAQCVEDYSKLAGCQLLIECVPEDMHTKQTVLKAAEAAVSEDCTIATNTSALPLDELAQALAKPDRFLGLHFFHPVDRMPLVEIVSLKTTSRKTMARAADYVTRLGKIPIMVKNGPGFLINRLLSCYLMAAARLLQEGVPLNWIESAALDFGMPLGPFEVLDEVGLDLGYKIATTLHAALGDRLQPPSIFETIPRLGLVGKKTGAGVYTYDAAGKRLEVNPKLAGVEGLVIGSEKPDEASKRQITKRLIVPMIDEAARCLEDRIVMKPREIDMAIVYGIGFPPFRGGLLKYADHIGLETVAAQVEQAHKEHGDRREVSPLIKKYLAEGRSFYSRGGKEED